MKKVIIVTGGIASGKSFIIEILRKLGYPIMQSDKVVKKIMQEHWFLNKMKKILGIGDIDLKKEIEMDSKVLDIIEEITYPKIKLIRQKFIETSHQNNVLPAIEIPLFFEKNISETLLEYEVKVISAICGKELQIMRVKERNQPMSDKLLNIVLSRQIEDEERLARSTFIVYTFLNKSVVKKQLIGILNSI
jgi:dephospho-CoA kinase